MHMHSMLLGLSVIACLSVPVQAEEPVASPDSGGIAGSQTAIVSTNPRGPLTGAADERAAEEDRITGGLITVGLPVVQDTHLSDLPVSVRVGIHNGEYSNAAAVELTMAW